MKRRIGLITVIALCAILAQAQQKGTHSRTSFGLRGGVNFQTINGKDASGDKLENDILTGFNIGINAEIPVATDFYFQPGLLYTLKGAKSKDVILGETIEGTLKIAYVELPLNFLYKPLLGRGHLLLGFGPYVAMGIGGTSKYEGGGSSISQDVKFKNTVMVTDADDVVYIRPIDAGANFLFGYEFSNKVSIQLNAQLGLTKINPEYEGASNDESAAKNTGFGFSLGYRF
ncbi:MAG TPA: porin family protein [Chitinophagaceae bacterium]